MIDGLRGVEVEVDFAIHDADIVGIEIGLFIGGIGVDLSSKTAAL